MTTARAGPGVLGAAMGRRPAGRRLVVRRLAWGLAGLAALAVADLIAAVIAAGHYLPLSAGDPVVGFPAFAGFAAGPGITVVNTLGHYREDIYVSPQRAAFSLFASMMNTSSQVHPAL